MLRRLLFLVGAIVLIDTTFFAALTPLLPHYAHTIGLSKASAGLLQAMYPIGVLVASVAGGVAVARFGVKATVLLGLAILPVSTVAFGFATTEWQLDLARFIQGMSSAFSWTGGLAWLVAAAPSSRRGELIGSAFAAAIVGALFGPVLGAVASFTGTRAAFSVVAALAIVLAVAAARTPSAVPEHAQSPRVLVSALGSRRILGCIWLCLLPALLFGNLSVLVPLRLSVLGWGAAAVGATFLVSAGFEAVASPIVGRISDRRGRFLPIRVALIGSIVGTALLPWPDKPIVLAVLVILSSLAFGIFWPPAMSMITDAAESRGMDYGYAFALVNLAWAPGQAGGSALGGGIAAATSDAVPYVILCILCAVTLVVLQRHRAALALRPASS
ncbi:MAG TPA: MFS transporter [Gaiellaceae bacterium]|jgi:MFS family permease|nr:MFS transporter [Gaiellaceae bacterium]